MGEASEHIVEETVVAVGMMAHHMAGLDMGLSDTIAADSEAREDCRIVVVVDSMPALAEDVGHSAGSHSGAYSAPFDLEAS